MACDYAFPCATQNEVEEEGAQALVKGGCKGVFEGTQLSFFYFYFFNLFLIIIINIVLIDFLGFLGVFLGLSLGFSFGFRNCNILAMMGTVLNTESFE